MVLDEAASLVTCEARAPGVAVGLELLRLGRLTVWHTKASDLAVALNLELLVACEHRCLDVGALCSSLRVVAEFIWNLNAAEAGREAIHRHETLSGAGERQLLVRVSHRPLLCDGFCLFQLQVAIGLASGYWDRRPQRRVVVRLLHFAIIPTALLLEARERFRSQCHSELGARENGGIVLQRGGGAQHGFPRLSQSGVPRLFAPLAQLVSAMVYSSRSEQLL